MNSPVISDIVFVYGAKNSNDFLSLVHEFLCYIRYSFCFQSEEFKRFLNRLNFQKRRTPLVFPLVYLDILLVCDLNRAA